LRFGASADGIDHGYSWWRDVVFRSRTGRVVSDVSSGMSAIRRLRLHRGILLLADIRTGVPAKRHVPVDSESSQRTSPSTEGEQMNGTSKSTPGHAPEAILSVRGLTRAFGGLVAVNSLDFDLYTGRILALIGPNGAGKSTTINMLSGYIAPSKGTISFMGHCLNPLPPHERARQGLIRTFQNGRLSRRLTV